MTRDKQIALLRVIDEITMYFQQMIDAFGWLTPKHLRDKARKIMVMLIALRNAISQLPALDVVEPKP